MDEITEAEIVFMFLTEECPELLEYEKGKEILMQACRTIAQYPERMKKLGRPLTKTIIKLENGKIIDFGDLSKSIEVEPIKYLN
jgi:hypothetical protein